MNDDTRRSTPAYKRADIQNQSNENRPAYILDQLSDCVDANTLHLSERTKQALRRLNAAIARQEVEEGTRRVEVVSTTDPFGND